MGERKRVGLEIMAEILELCKKPQPKTRVMYKTDLSYKTLQNYLSQLLLLKFLEVHHSRTTYQTTERGLGFLRQWNGLKAYLTKSENVRSGTAKQNF